MAEPGQHARRRRQRVELRAQARAGAHSRLWTASCGHSDLALGVWSSLVFVFLYLPIVVLVIFSFNKQPLNVEWTGFTFDWYMRSRTRRTRARSACSATR